MSRSGLRLFLRRLLSANRCRNQKRRNLTRSEPPEALEARVLPAVTIYSNAADNHLTNFQNQQANLGGVDQIQFYKAGDSLFRPLIRFDLSEVPSGTTIGDAQLQLWHSGGNYANSDMDMTLYALDRAWDEGSDFYHSETSAEGSSWVNASAGTPWTTPGGDFVTGRDFGFGNNGIVAEAVIPSYTESGWVSFNVTALVNEWVDGTLPNHGVAFVISSGDHTEHVFSSSESSAPEQHPRLVIDSDIPVTPGQLGFDVTSVTVDEEAGDVTLQVRRTGGSDGIVSVRYSTQDQTAVAPGDYTSAAGVLTFADGETSKSITVSLTDDSIEEAAESFLIQLSDFQGGAVSGAASVQVTIRAGDSAPGAELVLQNASDNHLTSLQNPDANLGGLDRLQLYRAEGSEFRPLIRFDLSSVPASQSVASASLGLYRDSAPWGSTPMTVQLYALTSSWEEGTGFDHYDGSGSGSSWRNRATGSAWSTEGGDYNGTYDFGNGPNGLVTEVIIPNFSEPGWIEFDVTTVAEAWLAGDITNHGLILIATAGDYVEYTFVSGDANETALRPRLTITGGSEPQQPGQLELVPAVVAFDENAGQAVLTVNRVAGSDGAVSVQFTAESGSAVSGSDFSPTTGTLEFADGEVSRTIVIPLIDDTVDEPDETFSVTLSNPTGGAVLLNAVSTVQITDNDEPVQPGSISLQSSVFEVDESAGSLDIPIVRAGGTDGVVTVQYQTVAASAEAGTDFEPQSGTATFADGQAMVIVSIPVTDDTEIEGDETFGFTIDSVTGGADLLAPRTATVTIRDDESGPTPLISYSNFNDVSGLNLNGSASVSGDRLQLTPNSGNTAGSAYLRQPLAVNADTSLNVSFSFVASGGTAGADGLAFVIQNSVTGSEALGGTGGAIGYSGIGQSLAVEFDTWQNTGDLNDNHISVLRDGNTTAAVTSAASPFDLNSGSRYWVWVDYSGASDQLDVRINNTPDRPAAAVLSTVVDLASVVGSQGFMGFSAGTGGAVNAHEIIDWTVLSDSDLLPPPPVSGTITAQTVFTGLVQPTSLDWSPDGRNMYVSEQRGIIRVARDGQLSATPFLDFTTEVNGTRDRGLLDIAVHPDFTNNPYVYLLYTYDPPEVFANTSHPLAGPDRNGNRAGRLTRVTADAATDYTTAVPGSAVTILGRNSTWDNFNAFVNSTTDFDEPPAGILPNGDNVQDFIATDSESHTVGAVEFGPDNALYVTIGDGTSYNRVDPRTARVQDIDNLSGKVLRIDPIDGSGLSDNPFFNGDPEANRSKVFQSGVRNAFRMTIDRTSGQVWVGDVGWTNWEEINTAPAGANFGWPWYEGGDSGSLRTNGYQDLNEAQAFYAAGTPVTEPLLALNHASTGINAIVLGDIYTGTAYPQQYQGDLFFNDLGQGIVRNVSLDGAGNVTDVQTFTTGAGIVVQIRQGPDGTLYYVDLDDGLIGHWVFDTQSASVAGTQVESAAAPAMHPGDIAGADVTIALIDTGIDARNPQLRSSLWSNPGETPGDGIDNDGNGFIDDVNGFDFADYDSDPHDTHGHGTFMAGLLAARNDGVSADGIVPFSRIMNLRAFDGEGSGSTEQAAAAIRYAAEQGADIILLAATVSDSDELRSALQVAQDHDVLVVAAAGDTAGLRPSTVASLSRDFANIISAAGLDAMGQPLPNSNSVGDSMAVQLSATGTAASTGLTVELATYSGSSVAAGFVAGAAAQVITARPSLSAADVRSVLTATADDSPADTGSAGILNAGEAADLVRSPGQVTQVDVAEDGSEGGFSFRWNPVRHALGYDIWFSSLGTGALPQRVSVTDTSWSVEGLPVGRHRFWVRPALPGNMKGSWSEGRTVRVRTAPHWIGETRLVTDGSLHLEWNSVAGASGYELWFADATNGDGHSGGHVSEQSNWTAEAPLTLGDHHVWVRATDAEGLPAAWSGAISIASRPQPELRQSDISTVNNRPVFAWEPTPGADRYRIWVDNMSTGVRRLIDVSDIPGSSFRPAEPLAPGDYRWWVQGVNDGVSGSVCSPWSAAGRVMIGAAPELTGARVLPDGTALFSWSTIDGASQYEIWIANDTTGQFRFAHAVTAGTSLQISEWPDSRDTFRVWLRAVGDVQGRWSSAFRVSFD